MAVTLATACTEQAPQISSPNAGPVLTREQAATYPGYVATPAGWFHASCVYAIPAGAKISLNRVVTRQDGTSFQITKCPYPAYLSLPHPDGRGGLVPPVDTGWVEYAWDLAPTGDSYRDLADMWVVPAPPAQSYTGTEVFYSFPGIQNTNPAPMILQPVIQYGNNGKFGGNYWTAASWWCDGPSGTCMHSTSHITVSPGDTIYGTVDASACAGRVCTWTVTTLDLHTGSRATPLAVADSDTYTFVTGGAMETHNGFSSCAEFPDDGVFHTGLSFAGRHGSLTPSWKKTVPFNPNPDCGFDVTWTSTTVNLIVNPPPPPHLSVSITGPLAEPAYTYVTVTGNVSNGVPPYTYGWTVNGNANACGNESSCTAELGGSGSQLLFSLTVTDAHEVQGSASHTVYTCPQQPDNPCRS